MKKTNKILTVILSIIIIISVIPVTASAGNNGKWSYTVISEEEKTAKIRLALTLQSEDKELIIPSTINGYTIVALADGAFSGTITYLEKVILPDTITSIGKKAFRGSNVKCLTIPAGVTFVGEDAFSGCFWLYDIYFEGTMSKWNNVFANDDTRRSVVHCSDGAIFPSGTCGDNVNWVLDTYTKSLTISGSGAMYDNDDFYYHEPLWIYHGTKKVIIDDGVTTIGDSVFSGCDSLISVTIPDSVTKIGEYAFCGCDSLTDITIPSSVTTIGKRAFADCDSLETIIVDSENQYYSSDEDGVLFDKDKTILLKYPEGKVKTKYKTPEGITTIGEYAFGWCKNLRNVTIGNSVTTIGDYAFYDCDSLTHLIIGNSVKTIDSHAFYDCDSLTHLIIGDSVTTIGESAFRRCPNLKTVTIGNGVTTIGKHAFEDCTSLTDVTIPDSVTEIGEDAFRGCKSLTSITIPDSVTEIGNYAFAHCKNLKNIAIGNSVTSIGDYTFLYCESLKTVTISNSITTIWEGAFQKCETLTDVYYIGTEEQWKNIYIDDYNKPLRKATIHYVTKTITPPTCTEQGCTTYTCSECGDVYNTDYVEAFGHDYSIITVTPQSCTEHGCTTYTCSECGDAYNTDYVDALGHNFLTPVYTAPPCVAKGYTIYECHCGASRLADFVDVTGHIDSDSDGICEQCNKTLNSSATDIDNSDTSGIFSIFNIIIELLQQLLNSLNFLNA